MDDDNKRSVVYTRNGNIADQPSSTNAATHNFCINVLLYIVEAVAVFQHYRESIFTFILHSSAVVT